MQARSGGVSRVLLMVVATAAAGCEVRTLPDADSTAATHHTDTVAGTVTTVPGSQRVVTAADSAVRDSAVSNSAVPDSAVSDSAVAASAVSDSVLRLEVDVDARKLRVYEGGRVTATYPVAVGSKAWPTQRGEWTVKQVIVNPAWIPPDETWAEEREPKDPGAPDNPLGRAQLVYDPPRTVHGTDQPASIGTATSHGSIRMTNASIVQLAKRVLAVSGSDKGSTWVDGALANRHEKAVADLPHPVTIRVR
jgi:lipoprotein-anchoring transpeptidase ErfK/SrfK